MMLTTESEKEVCDKYRRTDETGHAQCASCPLRLDDEVGRSACKACFTFNPQTGQWESDFT